MDVRQARLTETSEEDISGYRSISVWAVVGLLLGLVSPLAFVDPLLLAIPVACVLVCGWALWVIKQNAPAMIGRKAALTGIWLAVFSLALATGDTLYYRWRMRTEATQVAKFWFDLTAKHRPELAYQLTLLPALRQPLDEKLWNFYKNSEKYGKALADYVAPGKANESPRLIRTLLALGDSATIRYFKTLDQFNDETRYVVVQLYSVTFDDAGEKKTFLVFLRLVRHETSEGHAAWQIVECQGGVGPEGRKASKDEADK